MIPKKKYRDKVRERLRAAKELLSPERVRLIVKIAVLCEDAETLGRVLRSEYDRRRSRPREAGAPTVHQEIHNAADHLLMLLNKDVPALLDSLDGLANAEEA